MAGLMGGTGGGSTEDAARAQIASLDRWQKLTKAAKVDVLLTPDDAFGDYEAELVRAEPMDVFPDDVEMSIGMVFEADDPDTGDVLLFRVTDIADGKVMVDANHPLAGQTIRFIATVTDVKVASAEEISHGHAHGAHGHQH